MISSQQVPQKFVFFDKNFFHITCQKDGFFLSFVNLKMVVCKQVSFCVSHPGFQRLKTKNKIFRKKGSKNLRRASSFLDMNKLLPLKIKEVKNTNVSFFFFLFGMAAMPFLCSGFF